MQRIDFRAWTRLASPQNWQTAFAIDTGMGILVILLVIGVFTSRPVPQQASLPATPVTHYFVMEDQDEEQSSGEKLADEAQMAIDEEVTEGALRIRDDEGAIVECPLKHTDVKADISGFISRVTVTQTFANPSDEPIEAVYVFPLPHQAAVDQMTMVVGERRSVGIIKRRDDARAIYEAAIAAGQTASLLEQERPNIFRQTVGNIGPSQEVEIEISYVDVLNYDMGTYEFHFPMVVGPRFFPSGGPVPDDQGRISSPILRPDERNGHDIALQVNLNAGVPIQGLETPSHDTVRDEINDHQATFELAEGDRIPNKDFVLRYKVAGKKPEMAVLSHTGEYSHDASRLGKGYFLLMIQPSEDDEALRKEPPREFVFLVDVSGSMRGAKTEKAKECMANMLGICRPEDRLQVVTFASRADKLFDAPVPVNEDTIAEALRFSQSQQGSGGTMMLDGVKMAMDAPIEDDRMRIVVMLSDGFIGNEQQIIEHVGTTCGDQIRFWAIGIDASPNMHLIDGVAAQGGGLGKRLAPNEDAETLTSEVMSRIQRAQLSKISIDFGELAVTETYPAKIPELWSGRPIMLVGRYPAGAEGVIKINGQAEGEPVTWSLDVSLSDDEPGHDVLAKTWARRKIEELMQQTYYAGSPAVEEEVTGIALNYGLMSPFTSFVAVDAAMMPVDGARPPRRVMVPIPLPAFNEWEGYFGPMAEHGVDRFADFDDGAVDALAVMPASGAGAGAPSGGGFGGGGGYPGGGGGLVPANRTLTRQVVELQQRGQAELAFRMTNGQNMMYKQAQLQLASGSASFGRPSRRLSTTTQTWAAMPARGGQASGFGLERESAYGYYLGAQLEAAEFESLSLSDEAKDLSDEGRQSYVQNFDPAFIMALRERYGKVGETAAERLAVARKLVEEGELSQARVHAVIAVYLGNIAALAGASDGTPASDALSLIEEMNERQLAEWIEAAPSLEDRLDLVIRDLDVTAALHAWSEACGIELALNEGALKDLEIASRAFDDQIGYMDLRNVPAWESLNWLTQSFGLNWRVTGDQVVVSTDRRSDDADAKTGWLYDVSLLFSPSPTDVEAIQGEDGSWKPLDFGDAFIGKVRRFAELGESVDITWFGAGRVLVVADAAEHQRLGQLLDTLRNPVARPAGELGAWHETLREKVTKRQAFLDTLGKLQQIQEVKFAWSYSSMSLLSAVAGGDVDLESLTQLQIAWSSPRVADLLADKVNPAAAFSTWAIHEAGRSLPENEELAKLAEASSEALASSTRKAFETLAENPSDPSSFTHVLFAGLAAGRESSFANQAVEALQEAGSAGSGQQKLTLLAECLLLPTSAERRQALEELVGSGLENGTQAMLAAMACHRYGDSSWQNFREQANFKLRQLALDGDSIVFINRLPMKYIDVAR